LQLLNDKLASDIYLFIISGMGALPNCLVFMLVAHQSMSVL